MTSGASLPAPGRHPVLAGPLGGVVLQPWFDRIAPYWISRWVFPHQRALAAAIAAGGAPARFAAATGLDLAWAERLAPALRERAHIALGLQAAEQVWDSAFFAPTAPDPRHLVMAEVERRRAARAMISGGTAFLGLRKALAEPRWDVADPKAAKDEVTALGERPEESFSPPDPVAIERSHAVPSHYGRESWLRFASPTLGDTAWARVYEPDGVADPPSLIYLHGIAMETEYWADLADPINDLTRRGIRVIRPEGPWHGRRRLPGRFGGEPIITVGLLGFFRLFRAWASETACLVHWARQNSDGPVALGGVSLGALTTQRYAVAARDWPEALRPDALLLIATSGALRETALHGSLSRALRLPERLAESGWSEADLEDWAPLLEPRGPAAVPPERIVMLLGRHDDLTPFEGGLALAERWRVPEANLFLPPFGHFTVALRLDRDPGALERLVSVLGAGGSR